MSVHNHRSPPPEHRESPWAFLPSPFIAYQSPPTPREPTESAWSDSDLESTPAQTRQATYEQAWSPGPQGRILAPAHDVRAMAQPHPAVTAPMPPLPPHGPGLGLFGVPALESLRQQSHASPFHASVPGLALEGLGLSHVNLGPIGPQLASPPRRPLPSAPIPIRWPMAVPARQAVAAGPSWAPQTPEDSFRWPRHTQDNSYDSDATSPQTPVVTVAWPSHARQQAESGRVITPPRVQRPATPHPRSARGTEELSSSQKQ